jgi:hypothetical protein
MAKTARVKKYASSTDDIKPIVNLHNVVKLP